MPFAFTFMATWLFNHTGGSVLMTVLLHASEGSIQAEGWVYVGLLMILAIGLVIFDWKAWRSPAPSSATTPATRSAAGAVTRNSNLKAARCCDLGRLDSRHQAELARPPATDGTAGHADPLGQLAPGTGLAYQAASWRAGAREQDASQTEWRSAEHDDAPWNGWRSVSRGRLVSPGGLESSTRD